MAMVPRIITAFGVSLTREAGGELGTVRPVNLSENGLCVRLDRPLELEDRMRVRVTLEEQGTVIDALARVVWVRKDSQIDRFYGGLGFVDLPDSERLKIRAYVEQGAVWLLAFLSEFPLFEALSEADCRELLTVITLRDLVPREILYRAGEREADMNGLFIVYNGLLSIFKSKEPDAARQLAVVSAGQIFGEVTLVTESEHTATVMAVNPSRLIQISKAGFMALRKRQPALCLKIMEIVARVLAARLGRATSKLFSPVQF